MRPDWGHGPNEPVPMWTEAEIRDVMRTHFPVPSEIMWCAECRRGDFTADHLITELKEARRAREHLHPVFD